MYLDPGFGSMLVQLLVAGLAVAGAVFGIFRTKIAAFLKRKDQGTTNRHDETL